jgi:hypothetical protein
VLIGSPTRAPLVSIGLQPTKNLLFIVRICFPRFCFWTDILRPVISFPSPLQEVGILCVCLCLVVFLLDLVLYRLSSLFVHDSQRCFIVCALPHVHLSLSFRFKSNGFLVDSRFNLGEEKGRSAVLRTSVFDAFSRPAVFSRWVS